MEEEAAAAAVEPAAAPEPASDAQPEAPREIPSAREAVRRALAQDDPTEPDARPARDESAEKPAEASDREDGRDEKGRFKAKDAGQTEPDQAEKPEDKKAAGPEAPARFSADAKAAWKDAPVAVKAEVNRAFRELETGLQQYQQDFGELREYAAMARQNGVSLKAVYDDYMANISALNQNPKGAIEAIAKQFGVDVRTAWAAQDGQEQAAPVPPQIEQILQQNAALTREIQRLQQGFGAIQQETAAQKAQREINEQVARFAAEHERFDELRQPIVDIITKTGADLATAYEYAVRMNPPAPPPKQEDPQAAQTREKAKLSISGHPANGSDPMTRAPAKSAREAVRRALAS